MIDSVGRRLLQASSLAYRIRRRFYHRTARKRQVAARRVQFYKDLWREAAASAGCELRQRDGGPLEILHGRDVLLRARGNTTSLDDPLTLRIAEDKPLVYRLLGERGVPTPRHLVCAATDLASARRFLRASDRACVVKPARDTAGAIGVTTSVFSLPELVRALAYGGAFSDDLLLEEEVPGLVYRLLYFDGELLDAVLRLPPTVEGDGVSTIQQLIAAENERREQGGIEASQSMVNVDGELRLWLRRQGLSLRSVPHAGVCVQIKGVVNDNRREDNVSAVESVCDAVVAAGAEAAQAVGARLAGVDVITPDITLPLGEAGGVVIEVNTTPGYYYHYMQRDSRVPVASLIVQRLLEASS